MISEKRSVTLPGAFFMNQRQVDFLIVGQGIAGTLLSAELLSRGFAVCVLGQHPKGSASDLSSAIIQPLAGRRLIERKTQREEIEAAVTTYDRLSRQLETELFRSARLLRMHQEEAELSLYRHYTESGKPFVREASADESLSNFRDVRYGAHMIAPVYQIFPDRLLAVWRKFLLAGNAFIEGSVKYDELNLFPEAVKYQGVVARALVFCEGAGGRLNPFFPTTIMNKNRGEFLLLSIPDLDDSQLYQGPLRLIPKGSGLWWCGSNYRWQYNDLLPDDNWRSQTMGQLNKWLKLPFAVVDHCVSERPTTAGQKPLLLQHEFYRQLYFFNGLGTRGFSAGPLLASRMADFLTRPQDP